MLRFLVRYENNTGRIYEERLSQDIEKNATFNFIIRDLRPSSTYLVRVLALTAVGESEESNQLNVKTSVQTGQYSYKYSSLMFNIVLDLLIYFIYLFI